MCEVDWTHVSPFQGELPLHPQALNWTLDFPAVIVIARQALNSFTWNPEKKNLESFTEYE